MTCPDTITLIDVFLWSMIVAAYFAGHWMGRNGE